MERATECRSKAEKHAKQDDVEAILKLYDEKLVELISCDTWSQILSHGDDVRLESFVARYADQDGLSHTIYIIMGTPGPIQALEGLIKQVTTSSSAPIPELLKTDTSTTSNLSAYILLSNPVGKPLDSISDVISPADTIRTNLALGAALKAVHSIQNDWFGIPLDPNEWNECYSWQECFTLLLEEALFSAEQIEALKEWIPFEEIRRVLGRAIGFYLFDDVEVPCLVWNASLSWDDSAFVDASEQSEVKLSSLQEWGGVLWGDPLMEGAFRDPSKAFIEGYGGSPIIFARQKTKRMWYTIYIALRTLLTTNDGDGEAFRSYDTVKTLLLTTVDALKDAPCY